MKLHLGNLTFTVVTNPGLPPESFAIVTETEVALWESGTITMLSRDEYDRRTLNK
jgi:hypothetical protein